MRTACRYDPLSRQRRMLDYDREAGHYDETRGGPRRAESAARALMRLLPDGARIVVDVGGGTGIVAAALTSSQRRVVVCDASLGMLRRAADRLPGRVIRADSTRLPLADGCVDAVTSVWLLHLLDVVAVKATVREAARVLSPGGRYLTTVAASAQERGDLIDVVDQMDCLFHRPVCG